MLIEPIHFKTKDGRNAVIRNARHEDAEGMLAFLVKAAGETEFLMRYPEECSRYTVEGEYAFLDGMNDSETDLMVVAEVEGVIAGNCQVTFRSHNMKTSHRGDIGIALTSEYWNQGLGGRMLDLLIETAKKNPACERLELEVVEGNERAMHLYQKKGFRLVGVHPDNLKLKDGSYRNEYLMYRDVK